jgi:hypothetical protein
MEQTGQTALATQTHIEGSNMNWTFTFEMRYGENAISTLEILGIIVKSVQIDKSSLIVVLKNSTSIWICILQILLQSII